MTEYYNAIGEPVYMPFGGATTLSEASAWMEAQEKLAETQADVWLFEDVSRNIMNMPGLTPDERSARLVALAKEQADAMKKGTKSVVPARKVSILEHAKSLFFGGNNPVIHEAAAPGAWFSLQKDKTGAMRFTGVYSNNYRDLENDVFTRASHQEFADHCEATKEYPALVLWHEDQKHKIGQADWVDEHDGFALVSGTFDVDVDPVVIENLTKEKGLGMSHGFRYKLKDKSGGVISRYRTFEVSILPVEFAANPLTSWETNQVGEGMKTQREEWIAKITGEPAVKQLKDGIASFKELADREGLDFKSIATMAIDNAAGATPPAPAQVTAPAAGATDGSTPPKAPAEPVTTAPGAALDVQALGAAIGEAVTKGIKELGDQLREEFKAIRQPEIDAEKALDERVAALLSPRGSLSETVARKSVTYGGGGNDTPTPEELQAAKDLDGELSDMGDPAAFYSSFGDAFKSLVTQPASANVAAR